MSVRPPATANCPTDSLMTIILLLGVVAGTVGCLLMPPDKRALMTLKNRVEIPASTDYDPAVTLEALLQPGDDTHRWSSSKAATVQGYVVAVQAAGLELTNGFLPHRRDIHIDIATRRDAPPRERVVLEVTPAMRDRANRRGWDWSEAALRRELVGRLCRFEGWLLFDREHADQSENTNPRGSGNWRATAWEVHPVTSITVVQ